MFGNQAPHGHGLSVFVVRNIKRNIGMLLLNIPNQFRRINGSHRIMSVELYTCFNTKLLNYNGIFAARESNEVSFWRFKGFLPLN